jgi:glucan phosphoethanolaminetransferase (alkaline phosphatase superfamily)
MFFFNIVLAVLTFVAYVLPFLAPKLFPILSVLTLVLPLFLILNALFFVFWAIQLKRHVILSALVLLMGITFINKFYKFSSVNLPESEKDWSTNTSSTRSAPQEAARTWANAGAKAPRPL